MSDLNEGMPRIFVFALNALSRLTRRNWFLYVDAEGRTKLWFGVMS